MEVGGGGGRDWRAQLYREAAAYTWPLYIVLHTGAWLPAWLALLQLYTANIFCCQAPDAQYYVCGPHGTILGYTYILLYYLSGNRFFIPWASSHIICYCTPDPGWDRPHIWRHKLYAFTVLGFGVSSALV